MQDINTGFYFIRFPHLANEHGLKIEAGESPRAEGEGKPEEGDNRMRSLESLGKNPLCPTASSFLKLILIVVLGLLRSKCHSIE